MTTKIDLIVTRHPTLVQLLIERGLATSDTHVIEHAKRSDVLNLHVAGVLPHHLSSAAASVTEIPMRLTLADREAAQSGDLPLDRIRQIAGDATTYVVQAVDHALAPSLAISAAVRYCEGFHGVVDGPITHSAIGPQTWRGLDVMYFASMCQQFSAAVVLSRGIWMPRAGTNGRKWLDGLGNPIDTTHVEGSVSWGWRLRGLDGLVLSDYAHRSRFTSKSQAWAAAEQIFAGNHLAGGPLGVQAIVDVAPAPDTAWGSNS